MELTFCTLAFRNDPIEEVLPRVAESGYDSAEIFWAQLEGKSDADLQALRAMCDDLGLGVAMISPYLSFTRDQAEWDASMKRVAACANAARILDAPKIRTFTDVGPTGVGSDVATDQQWAMCIDAFKKITAANSDLTFVLETHVKTLADSAASTRKLMAAVDAPNLKLLLHPAAGGDFGDLAGYQAFADVTVHMHLNNRTPDGEMTFVDKGTFDFPAFIADIRQAGYDGTIAVEYCFPGATWDLAASAAKHLAPCVKG